MHTKTEKGSSYFLAVVLGVLLGFAVVGGLGSAFYGDNKTTVFCAWLALTVTLGADVAEVYYQMAARRKSQ